MKASESCWHPYFQFSSESKKPPKTHKMSLYMLTATTFNAHARPSTHSQTLPSPNHTWPIFISSVSTLTCSQLAHL